MKKFTIYSILLLMISCNTGKDEVMVKNVLHGANYSCGQFIGSGQLVQDSYTFCAIVPVKQNYYYKKGKWKFWDLKGNYISEVNFRNQVEIIKGDGGCSYELTRAIITSSSDSITHEIKVALEACTCKSNSEKVFGIKN